MAKRSTNNRPASVEEYVEEPAVDYTTDTESTFGNDEDGAWESAAPAASEPEVEEAPKEEAKAKTEREVPELAPEQLIRLPPDPPTRRDKYGRAYIDIELAQKQNEQLASYEEAHTLYRRDGAAFRWRPYLAMKEGFYIKGSDGKLYTPRCRGGIVPEE